MDWEDSCVILEAKEGVFRSHRLSDTCEKEL